MYRSQSFSDEGYERSFAESKGGGKSSPRKAAMRGKQFRYFTYLEEAFESRENEGVYLLPNYICINDWSDRYREKVVTSSGEKEMITDVIHLGRNGYLKEAAMIEAYLFDIFN